MRPLLSVPGGTGRSRAAGTASPSGSPTSPPLSRRCAPPSPDYNTIGSAAWGRCLCGHALAGAGDRVLPARASREPALGRRGSPPSRHRAPRTPRGNCHRREPSSGRRNSSARRRAQLRSEDGPSMPGRSAAPTADVLPPPSPPAASQESPQSRRRSATRDRGAGLVFATRGRAVAPLRYRIHHCRARRARFGHCREPVCFGFRPLLRRGRPERCAFRDRLP